MSDSLLVEKIAGTNGKEVIVTYVARDSANNVGKASRVFPVARRPVREEMCCLLREKGWKREVGTEKAGMTEPETERRAMERQFCAEDVRAGMKMEEEPDGENAGRGKAG